MAKTAVRSVDLEAIDRLEEKMKQLVGAITKLRAEQARLTEENGKLAKEQARLADENAKLAKETSRLGDENGGLARELDQARARLNDAEAWQSELSALKDERDTIRGRVAEMLQQLDGLAV